MVKELRGSTLPKSIKFANLFLFLQIEGLYVPVDHVQKYYAASSTVNHTKTGSDGGNSRTFIMFSDDLLLLLKMVILPPFKE